LDSQKGFFYYLNYAIKSVDATSLRHRAIEHLTLLGVDVRHAITTYLDNVWDPNVNRGERTGNAADDDGEDLGDDDEDDDDEDDDDEDDDDEDLDEYEDEEDEDKDDWHNKIGILISRKMTGGTTNMKLSGAEEEYIRDIGIELHISKRAIQNFIDVMNTTGITKATYDSFTEDLFKAKEAAFPE
jgi:hypothetical protein